MTTLKNTTLKARVGDQTLIDGKIWNIVGDQMQGPKVIFKLERANEKMNHVYEMKKKNHLYKVEKSGQHKV